MLGRRVGVAAVLEEGIMLICDVSAVPYVSCESHKPACFLKPFSAPHFFKNISCTFFSTASLVQFHFVLNLDILVVKAKASVHFQVLQLLVVIYDTEISVMTLPDVRHSFRSDLKAERVMVIAFHGTVCKNK